MTSVEQKRFSETFMHTSGKEVHVLVSGLRVV